MFKVALFAAAVVVAASAAMAANAGPGPDAAPAGDSPCHPAQSLDLACTVRTIDTNGDGTLSADELATFAAPLPAPPAADWASHATELDFKDAAAEPGTMLPVALESDNSHRLVPALFALGALVILLRRRPT